MAPLVIAGIAGLLAAGGWYELRRGKKKTPMVAPTTSVSPASPPAAAPKPSAAPAPKPYGVPAPKQAAVTTPAAAPADAKDDKGVTDPFAPGAVYGADKPVPGGISESTQGSGYADSGAAKVPGDKIVKRDSDKTAEGEGAPDESIADKASKLLAGLTGGEGG